MPVREGNQLIAKERRRIFPMVRRWRDSMGLGNWRVDVTYHDGTYELDGGMSGADTVGSCKARWQYQTAHLQFNAQLTKDYDADRLEEIVVHELGHALVNEMRAANLPVGWSRDENDAAHEERVVTLITNAILYAAGKR